MLVEFEKKCLLGAFFLKNWGHFFKKLGAMGANVSMEFEQKNFNWGHFFK